VSTISSAFQSVIRPADLAAWVKTERDKDPDRVLGKSRDHMGCVAHTYALEVVKIKDPIVGVYSLNYTNATGARVSADHPAPLVKIIRALDEDNRYGDPITAARAHAIIESLGVL
jgi:hypothetical protein